jgi:hypothetical protein
VLLVMSYAMHLAIMGWNLPDSLIGKELDCHCHVGLLRSPCILLASLHVYAVGLTGFINYVCHINIDGFGLGLVRWATDILGCWQLSISLPPEKGRHWMVVVVCRRMGSR